MGTEIFKIDAEMAEKIEVEVGNPHLETLATLVGELWYSRDWWPFRPSGGRLAVANPL